MIDVDLSCKHYAGDEECAKCYLKGFIFSCTGCDITRQDSEVKNEDGDKGSL